MILGELELHNADVVVGDYLLRTEKLHLFRGLQVEYAQTRKILSYSLNIRCDSFVNHERSHYLIVLQDKLRKLIFTMRFFYGKSI
jgi:hypothetical protein